MPRQYVAEMLMDRIAASKTYMKERYTDASPLEYYRGGKAKRLMHPVTAAELERMLTILEKKGEKEFFRFVKDYYLRGGSMTRDASPGTQTGAQTSTAVMDSDEQKAERNRYPGPMTCQGQEHSKERQKQETEKT